MLSTNDIEKRIEDALPGAEVTAHDLTGTSDHFRVQVISEQFEGQSAIQRHRMIYDTLSDVMGGAIHALSLSTTTPNERN
jgi:stress-induced morphogen